MSRTAILRQMQEDLQQCRNCGLCEGRTQAVLGAGVPNSRIVIVGEGPGRNEDEQGKPFVGRSGQLLDQMLEQVGLSRNRNVFITNIVKCRPPENRDPMPEECLACRPWLDKILELIDPKIILCVGRIAAQQLFDPLLKLAPVLGARHHGGEVQGQQPLAPQVLGDLTGGDAPGQSLGHGGLELLDLLKELVQRAGDVRPVKAGLLCLLLEDRKSVV